MWIIINIKTRLQSCINFLLMTATVFLNVEANSIAQYFLKERCNQLNKQL